MAHTELMLHTATSDEVLAEVRGKTHPSAYVFYNPHSKEYLVGKEYLFLSYVSDKAERLGDFFAFRNLQAEEHYLLTHAEKIAIDNKKSCLKFHSISTIGSYKKLVDMAVDDKTTVYILLDREYPGYIILPVDIYRDTAGFADRFLSAVTRRSFEVVNLRDVSADFINSLEFPKPLEGINAFI